MSNKFYLAPKSTNNTSVHRRSNARFPGTMVRKNHPSGSRASWLIRSPKLCEDSAKRGLRTPPSLRNGMDDANIPSLKCENCPVLLERLNIEPWHTPNQNSIRMPLGRGLRYDVQKPQLARWMIPQEHSNLPWQQATSAAAARGSGSRCHKRSVGKAECLELRCWNTDLWLHDGGGTLVFGSCCHR